MSGKNGQKRCFVVMGFGTKTDLATGRKIDLDKSYRTLIKPVLKEKNVLCIRADEIPHSGIIDVPMYEQLLTADLVIADISTANPNAIYELGIRHALRPSTTIVISENELVYPFDLNHVLITRYVCRDGGLIDVEDADKFKQVLGDMVDAVLREPKIDSPVYIYLNELHPPSLSEKIAAAVAEAGHAVGEATESFVGAVRGLALGGAGGKPTDPNGRSIGPRAVPDGPTLAELIKEGEQAIQSDDFATAKAKFGLALEFHRARQNEAGPQRRDDPYLIQRLALATYKAVQPDAASTVKALNDALEVLAPLKLAESNDPETLGLAGAIEKRLFEQGQGVDHLAHAIKYYSRGYYLRDDFYNGINLAYLLNVRADTSLDPTDADRIADLVVANRTRRELLGLCDRELKLIEQRQKREARAHASARPKADHSDDDQRKSDWEQALWCYATKAEAYFGLGDARKYKATRKLALAMSPPPARWMIESFDGQIGRLRPLLEKYGHLLDPPWSMP